MEERGNKTIMCSVLFLDIAEYSKKSVAGQISLKDRFNSYLSAAIGSVPITDRIILDTGDGAAINFLGDVEDALKTALSLRESILNEAPDIDPPLLVRMGINLGPVRLVRDINGQPNIVGDGINVAQRVMGFAEAGQILVSRSYYDAVSRLSPQYAGLFHFQGSRTDKHVRDHEVYAVGLPGEKTSELLAATMLAEEEAKPAHLLAPVKSVWHSSLSSLNGTIESALAGFKQATPGRRALYVGAVVIPVLLVGALLLRSAHNGEAPVLSAEEQRQAVSGVPPASAVAQAVSAVLPAEGKGAGAHIAAKPDLKKIVEARPDAKKAIEAKPGVKKGPDAKVDDKKADEHVVQQKAEPARKDTAPAGTGSGAEHFTEAYIAVICQEGTQVFVDGAEKGKVVSTGLTVAVKPGKHKVIIASKHGALHAQDIELEAGKTAQLKPRFCE